MSQILPKNKGLTRLIYACRYSWKGLISALKNEAAFRQEAIAFIVLAFVSFFFDVTAIERLALIASLIFILIVELLNSAIECVVDRIGTEHHVLSGRAKDYGSLAVLLSILLACATWWIILF